MTIALRQVHYTIGRRSILSDVDVATVSGQLMAIVGPNGAGKSTLLRLMAGVLQASAGDICLDGVKFADVARSKIAARRALLAQESSMQAHFSVRDLVALGMAVSGAALSSREKADIIDKTLSRVDLLAMEHRDVMTLSGGERQRAHLARVLAQLAAGEPAFGPGTLLLDEPIAAQDLARQKLILDIAREYANSGGSVVIVLHDLNWAAARADHMVVVAKGGIAAQGAAATIVTDGMLASIFNVVAQLAPPHPGNGRPFVLPHDLADTGQNS